MRTAVLIGCCLLLQQVTPEPEETFNFISYEMEAIYEYLLSSEEQEAYDALDSDEERKRFLYRFWRQFDPTPETPDYNELMLKFLGRVELANLLYGLEVEVEGWRTDRGKVLIFFGPPLEIRRSRFGPSSGAKYEIWIYGGAPEGTEGVQLIFEDELDSGEFVLRTEIVFPDVPSADQQIPRLAETEDEGRQ